MANEKIIHHGVIIRGTLPSGSGDNLLTIDPVTGLVGSISGTPLTTTLTSANIFVGNASNVATAVAVTGPIAISNTGVTSIVAGSIVNADINSSAAIALSKLAATTASRAVVSDGSGFLTASATTATQIGYLSTVTSDVQTQLNAKQATITGGATTIATANLTIDRALISNGSGKVAISSVTATELGYLSGLSSNVQTQIDSKPTVSLSSPTDGDILYYSGGVYTNLGIGSVGEVLTVSGSNLPEWTTGTSNGLPSGGTTNDVLIKNSGTDYDASFGPLTLSYIADVTALPADLNLMFGLDGVITGTELSYLAGATSDLQTQINNKLNSSLAYQAIWVGGPSNTPQQLSAGSNGAVLTIVSGSPVWQAPPTPGTFSGPLSSTDNAVVRFNGTAGDAGQNSSVIIDDSDNVSGVATLSTGQVSVLNQAAVRLYETGSTNYVGLRAAGTMASDYTITLPAAAPGSNTFLKYDGADYVWATGGGGATAFTDLTDVPTSYAGEALKLVRVNAGETALEFTTAGTGTVTSVSGTASRISSTGGTTPVIDIDAAYVGQVSITTLGTITTGVWNGTDVPLSAGGTGATLSDPGADRIMFWDDSGSAVTWLSAGATLSISGTSIGIATNGVGDSQFRQSAALSVVGRSSNSTGDVSDITAGTDNHVLRRSGTSIGFGTIGDASISALAWSKLTSTPTTLAGYGITDAFGAQDLFFPASGMWPRTTNGCASLSRTEVATSLVNIQTLDFDQTTQEFAQFMISFPRNWNNGTVTIKFYWTATSGSGAVVWGVSAGAYSNDDPLTTALGTAQTVAHTLTATNDLQITSYTSAITIAGTPADADFIAFQISRNPSDGGDTLTADAKLIGVVITLTTDAAVAA